MLSCPLCHSDSHEWKTVKEIVYHHCPNCGLAFKHPQHFLSPDAEKERYQLHENDINDPDYRQFVSPIVDTVKNSFQVPASGLDFGAGTGPVISSVLREAGYHMALYDPFFHPDSEALVKCYDFVACCEVAEHFYHPDREFELLSNLLRPGGKLLIMTERLPSENFEKWYYKEDPTHVVFYNEKSLSWIKRNLGFSGLELHERLCILTKQAL